MYHFNNIIKIHKNNGFTLLEVIGAIAIIAIVVSTVLVVTNNCMVTAMNTKAKMLAFNIARENMETVLAKSVIEEFVEYGYDEINPDIEWTTEVQSFTEPVSSNMWIQAICSASYTDSNSERQTVELTHWVTGLSDADAKKIKEDDKSGKKEDEEKITLKYLIRSGMSQIFWPMYFTFMEPIEVTKTLKYMEENPEQ